MNSLIISIIFGFLIVYLLVAMIVYFGTMRGLSPSDRKTLNKEYNYKSFCLLWPVIFLMQAIVLFNKK